MSVTKNKLAVHSINRLFIMANKSLPIFIRLHNVQSYNSKGPFLGSSIVFNHGNRYQQIHIMST